MRRCILLLSFWSLLCIWESWPEAPSWIKGKQSVGKYFKANTGKYLKMLGNTSKSTRTAKKRRRIPSQAISCRRIWKSGGWDEPVKKMPKFAVLGMPFFFTFFFFFVVRDSSPNLSFPAAASADIEALWPFRYHFSFFKVFRVSCDFDHILWVFRVAEKVGEVFLFCTAVSCSFIALAHFHRQHKTINTNEIFLPLSMTHHKQSTIT